MFLAKKTVETGIVFTLLIAVVLGLRLTSFAAGSGLTKDMPAVVYGNDVKKMQQALYDRGHYRGKVDGVIGLRTRASIRSFQKAENLPVTGQFDTQTAGKLGVRPGSIRSRFDGAGQNMVEARERPGHEPSKAKPSAGTKWAKGVRRPKTLPKTVPTIADYESGRGYREERLHAENEKTPQ